MKTTTEYAAKLEAFKAHLIENENFTEEEAEAAFFDERFDSFQCGSWEYLVLTYEEAERAAREEIQESLWAFNPEFVLRHTEFFKNSCPSEDKAFCDALSNLQGTICEGANLIVKALIADFDKFVEDAIFCDGRGHFIARYDGEEVECGDFYLYRIN